MFDRVFCHRYYYISPSQRWISLEGRISDRDLEKTILRTLDIRVLQSILLVHGTAKIIVVTYVSFNLGVGAKIVMP